MKPAPFTYLRPDSVGEAVAALSAHGGDARVLAGGQSLMAMLNLRLVEPSVLVDISRLEELRTIRLEGNMIEVGAAEVPDDEVLAAIEFGYEHGVKPVLELIDKPAGVAL